MSFEIQLRLPDNIDKARETRTVCIDTGIEEVIKHLWKNDIQTRGCCSGHGKDNPSIVISEEYDNKQIQDIRKIIAEVDIRDWDIYQWRLNKV